MSSVFIFKANPLYYVPEKKMSALTPLMHMLWSIIFNQTCRILYSDYKNRFDHSETILGPFKKLTFFGPDSLPTGFIQENQLTLPSLEQLVRHSQLR
jgi:hypothetical protein